MLRQRVVWHVYSRKLLDPAGVGNGDASSFKAIHWLLGLSKEIYI